MCGIFCYVGRSYEGADLIFNGLKDLEYRGYDSWGIAVKKSDGTLYISKKVGKIGDATLPEIKSQIGIGHTRWATHGRITENNAHPHISYNNKVVLVHNGIVENFQDLKHNLIQAGIELKSQTDSEIIVNQIGKSLDEGMNEFDAVQSTFIKLGGRNSFVAFFPEIDKLIVAKNGSPIVVGIGKNEYFVASDPSAILAYTDKAIFLEDGQYALIDKFGYQIGNISTGRELNIKPQRLDYAIELADKGGYDHFLIKEIMEQGKTIIQAIKQDKKELDLACDLVKKAKNIYLVACGTAFHACREGAYILAKIATVQVNLVIASEFAYSLPFIDNNSLVIVASQSGETADVLEAMTSAHEKGAKVLALVNVQGSSIYRLADHVLTLNAGPEKAVLSTKAFTSKVTVFYLLAHSLSGKLTKPLEIIARHAQKIDIYLHDKNVHQQIKEIAQKLKNQQNIYVLGRGLSYPIALETAHKLKEATYIHAEGFAGGEPKHCELSLISEGVATIIIAPKDETYADIISNACEFKARGGYIIGISPESHEVFDEWIEIPNFDLYSPLATVLPGQLLAYYTALELGNDPDKPRNLAKSVTVK